ncbi:hypothetical protein JL720_7885 [Aureococcus anophagefferens]|nr:hypothetical protein JL720_7885 [Aureococcus anophagefferens]
MSAAKRARTTRSSSSRSATSSFTLQGDESATCAVPEADARKSPTLRALLDEGARSRAVPATLETLSASRLPPGYGGAADLSADQARPPPPTRGTRRTPAQAAPPWLAPIVNVWNRCASRLMGYGPEDVMGNNLVQNFITKEYRALVQAAGARVEVLLNATPRRDERGAVIGVVGIGQDITARINQEREYALDRHGDAPIFGVGVSGKVNVWNQCAIRMTGYTGEDVMGKHLVNEFITDDYKSSVQDILLNATTRRDEHGAVLGVVGIGQDITARIAQEQEYARLIDTANAPIFGIDADGNVNVWNRCASRLMGYGPEDVMGNNLVQNFITKEYRALVQAVFDNALGGVETANFEFPLVTKAGARVEVLLNATPRRDERGAVIGVVGIGQDITARINQERVRA